VQLLLPSEIAESVHDSDLRLHGLCVSPREGGPRILEVCPGLGDDGALIEHSGARGIRLGFGLVDLGLEELRIDQSNDLPSRHAAVVAARSRLRTRDAACWLSRISDRFRTAKSSPSFCWM
jgi:hypothetical protein